MAARHVPAVADGTELAARTGPAGPFPAGTFPGAFPFRVFRAFWCGELVVLVPGGVSGSAGKQTRLANVLALPRIGQYALGMEITQTAKRATPAWVVSQRRARRECGRCGGPAVAEVTWAARGHESELVCAACWEKQEAADRQQD